MRSSHFIYDSFSVCAKRRNDKTINISILLCRNGGRGTQYYGISSPFSQVWRIGMSLSLSGSVWKGSAPRTTKLAH